MVVPERPSPWPMRCVLFGSIHVEEIPMVPVGKRMVEGGGLAIPAQGLAAQVMLVPVAPGSPRASMTAPVEGYELPLRMLCSTAQMSVLLFPNVLASMKADEPTVFPDALYTVFWPSLFCALAGIGEAESQVTRTAKIAENGEADVNLIVPFIFLSP
jgi:hypothetical protein